MQNSVKVAGLMMLALSTCAGPTLQLDRSQPAATQPQRVRTEVVNDSTEANSLQLLESAGNQVDLAAEAEAGPITQEQVGPEATIPESVLAVEQKRLLASLPSQGLAPELLNEIWLNSKPLRLADLRGKVVLLDMWTFGWINCIHTIPSLREWHQTYADDGLVVIGNHYPEFTYERDLARVQQALIDLDVPYPVAIDNDGRTWRAYNNRYWPTLYLIDKAGHIRHVKIGEGGYEQTERIIHALLVE